ncbi:cytochrome P450 2D20-like [Spea bombifrons]|uniref:cytochrome P450 2D20-like n=1 Tax=Spea bombifrons TaxID=233779 RepID=UPI002348FE72|nr:cytochrome P450 2D20-like [Spea bombifrons]
MELLSASLMSLWNGCLIGLALLCLALVFDFVKNRRRGARYPPGPVPLPFVGNLLSLDFNRFPDSLVKLRRKYGNIFSLQMFSEKVVVLNNYDTIKEALITKSEDTSDRPPTPIFDHLGFNNGIVFSNYTQHWKARRRFALHTLRDFGMGKKTIEERVREEAGYLCSAFQAEEGHAFDPYLLLNNAVSNVICSIIFGDRFDYNDKTFQRIIYLLKEMFQLETGLLPQVYKVFPWLLNTPGPHQKLFTVQKMYMDSISVIIKKHKETWDPAVKRDFIDAFLEEMEKTKGDPQSSFNDVSLLSTISDLFVGGTETTSNTLRWALLMMLLHPHIQNRVHKEIDQVIGPDKIPTMEDHLNMHYTNAVVHEVQRYGNILPTAIFHMTQADTKIKGFDIPKGTTIIPNLTSVLKDEDIWEKPYQFYPEHFLDAQGNFFKRDEFIPFSAGRRICLGEQLARMELFIIFTSLLQKFEFCIPPKQPPPRDDPMYMFNFTPQPFQVCAKVR